MLYLAWQAPDKLGDRFRWAVGELKRAGSDYELRYFRGGQEFERLNGRSYQQLLRLGYRGYPAFDLDVDVHQENVLKAFMRRLPPTSRADFLDFRRQFRISDDVSLSEFGLLGQTEAKLPSDGFSLVDPLDPLADSCDLMLEVVGHRYAVSALSAPLSAGQFAQLAHEPTNPADPNAVVVSVREEKIGYVNRLQTEAFRAWLQHRSITAVVERLNGTADRPRVFIFVTVRPKHTAAAA